MILVSLFLLLLLSFVIAVGALPLEEEARGATTGAVTNGNGNIAFNKEFNVVKEKVSNHNKGEQDLSENFEDLNDFPDDFHLGNFDSSSDFFWSEI